MCHVTLCSNLFASFAAALSAACSPPATFQRLMLGRHDGCGAVLSIMAPRPESLARWRGRRGEVGSRCADLLSDYAIRTLIFVYVCCVRLSRPRGSRLERRGVLVCNAWRDAASSWCRQTSHSCCASRHSAPSAAPPSSRDAQLRSHLSRPAARVCRPPRRAWLRVAPHVVALLSLCALSSRGASGRLVA